MIDDRSKNSLPVSKGRMIKGAVVKATDQSEKAQLEVTDFPRLWFRSLDCNLCRPIGPSLPVLATAQKCSDHQRFPPPLACLYLLPPPPQNTLFRPFPPFRLINYSTTTTQILTPIFRSKYLDSIPILPIISTFFHKVNWIKFSKNRSSMPPKAATTGAPKAKSSEHASYQGKLPLPPQHHIPVAHNYHLGRLPLLLSWVQIFFIICFCWRVLLDMITEAIINLKEVCLLYVCFYNLLDQTANF